MRCGDIRAVLWEFLDGELDARQAATVRAHLGVCRPCQSRRDADRSFLASVTRLRDSDPASHTLRERVIRMLKNRGMVA